MQGGLPLKRFAWLGSLVVLAVILNGCSRAANSGGKTGGAAPRTVQVTANEFAFSPGQISLKTGETVVLEVQNQGTVLHDLTVVKMPVGDEKELAGAHHDMSGTDMKDVTVHVAAEAGQTGKVQFRPTQAGTYTFLCTQPAHKDSGMTGTIVVE